MNESGIEAQTLVDYGTDSISAFIILATCALIVLAPSIYATLRCVKDSRKGLTLVYPLLVIWMLPILGGHCSTLVDASPNLRMTSRMSHHLLAANRNRNCLVYGCCLVSVIAGGLLWRSSPIPLSAALVLESVFNWPDFPAYTLR